MAMLAILLRGAAAEAQEQVGSVAALEGRAEALHPGQAAWTAVAAHDAVLLGDQLRTLVDSKLKLVFRDDSALTLAASSQLTVDEQVVAPAASRFSLSVGMLRALVTDRYSAPGTRFEVETPTAVAGVRGTGFIVTYDVRRDDTLVLGLFDTTRVRSRSDPKGRATVLVERHYFTRVARGKLPTRPAPLEQRQLQALVEATEILAGGLRPEDELAPEPRSGPGPEAAGAPPAEPRRPSEKVLTPEAEIVDQPIDRLKGQPRTPQEPPPPPPPPPPRR